MRHRVALPLAATLLASACVPHGRAPVGRAPYSRPSAAIPPVRAAAPVDAAARRMCLAQLAADGARFTPLPDHVYTSQCSALNAVQLADIGMPVTNLGPMTCSLADALTRWTRDATQKAAVAWLDSPVVRIESFGTYSCRPINNVPGARLSEHGLANAVDISGFVLASGRRITVLADWNGADPNARNFLHAVHDAGCRRFHVVLGPDANALHRNHFHFDMGHGVACS